MEIILAANNFLSEMRCTRKTSAVAPLPSFLSDLYFLKKPNSHSFFLKIVRTVYKVSNLSTLKHN